MERCKTAKIDIDKSFDEQQKAVDKQRDDCNKAFERIKSKKTAEFEDRQKIFTKYHADMKQVTHFARVLHCT